MIPIIIGALGYVAKSLITYVKQLGFEENHAVYVIRKLQNLALGYDLNYSKIQNVI